MFYCNIIILQIHVSESFMQNFVLQLQIQGGAPMNILICEDNTDVLVQEEFVVEEAAQKISKKNVIHTTKTPQECIKMCNKSPGFYDVLFLDIELPKMSGIELGKILKKDYPFLQIVFVTSFDEYSLSAYDVHPFYYIVKPLTVEEVERVLCGIIEFEKNVLSEKHNTLKLHIEFNKDIISIPVNNIIYIQKEKNQSKIVTKSKNYFTYDTLKDLEKEILDLNITNLYRCHQSFIVNFDYIEKFEGDFFLLDSQMCIPISRSKKGTAKKIFYKYLRED